MKLESLKRLLELREIEEPTDEEKDELKALEEEARKAVDEPKEEEKAVTLDEVRALIDAKSKQVTRVAPDLGVKDKEVRVVNDEADSDATYVRNTLQLFEGILKRDQSKSLAAQRDLAKAGHYGKQIQSEARDGGEYYNTLIGKDGEFLLPTRVREEIDRKIGQFGAIAQVADSWDESEGRVRVSGSFRDLEAYATEEGGVIKSRKRAFKSVTLYPKKWGLIIPWTFEVGYRQGQKVIDDVNAALAMGFAKSQDDSAFNGDGSSNFNSIVGLFDDTRGDVGEQVIDATSYEDIDPDDFILSRNRIAPEFRNNMSYIFHPDMEAVFLTRKDDQGKYIFDYVTVGEVPQLKGVPVYYSQAMPSLAEIGADEPFGLLGNFGLWKMATTGGVFADTLREATVEDADSGDPFNLATQDGQAIRAKMLWDMDTNFEEGFCKFVTAAS